jgi:hypothetical protein
MEKAAVTGKHKAGFRWEIAACRACVAAVLACLGAPLWAQQGSAPPGEVLVAEARPSDAPLRLSVQASSLPRMDAQDSGFQAPRVDFSLLPATGSGLGPVIGMSGFAPRSQPVIGLQPIRPSVDVGLRWTHRLSHKQLDITAWKRMTNDDDALSLIQAKQQPVYGARIEMNLKSSARKSGLALDKGFIGVQLDSGARITIRRKNGGPMVYYRTTF